MNLTLGCYYKEKDVVFEYVGDEGRGYFYVKGQKERCRIKGYTDFGGLWNKIRYFFISFFKDRWDLKEVELERFNTDSIKILINQKEFCLFQKTLSQGDGTNEE